MSKYITKTGRAVSIGVQTRRSLEVRRQHRNQSRPLPMFLQVRPPAIFQTPRNEWCDTDLSARGIYLRIMRTYKPASLLLGLNLEREGEWCVSIRGVVRGRTDDGQFALAYMRAAKSMGYRAELLRGV